jgi:curved DNA-binding protein
MAEEDFYKILGVSRDADEKTIKKAYRKIARDNHPDLNPDDEEAEERFKRASVAFEVLSDSEKRSLYDEFGMAGLREGFDAEQARKYQQWQSQAGGRRPPGGGQRFYWSSGGGGGGGGPEFQDIFGSVFGGRSPFDTSDYSDFGGFYTGPLKGRDVEAALTLDFMTAVKGGELELRVDGKTIKVRIPAGADEGDKLRLKGKGSPAPEGAPKGSKAGDLLLSIHVKPHDLLERDGLDLYLDVPVTVSEAVLGAKIAVPTPHGDFNVTVPSGVNSGSKLRLKGKGVHRGKKEGDFYAVIQIQPPDRVTDEVRTAAEAIDSGYTQPVRDALEL